MASKFAVRPVTTMMATTTRMAAESTVEAAMTSLMPKIESTISIATMSRLQRILVVPIYSKPRKFAKTSPAPATAEAMAASSMTT